MSAGQEKHDPRTDVTFLVGIFFFLLTGVAPRGLIDPRGLPPHEALSDKIPEHVLTDKRWPLIRRIFQVGFQPSIDYRFQSASDLIQRLDEAVSPRDGEANPAAYQAEVEAIRELLQSTIAESIRHIEESAYASSKKLLQRIEAMAREAGLGVSTGDNVGMGRYVMCHFALHVPRRGISSEVISHHVEFAGPAKGVVTASYQFDQNERVTYYRGPAADTDRLEEEIIGHAGAMFKIAADNLRKRLENTLN